MRNLKRVLSLALALVMMLGMMVIGANAASTDFADADEITYTEAVDVMTALKVLEGDGTNYYPTDILNREQAATIVCKMLMGPANAQKLVGSNVYTDVAANRWSAGCIAYCDSLGILAGNGDGTFNPTGELTGVAFAKMLLVALGYDPTIEGYVNNKNWATNIGADAIAAGLNIQGVDLANPVTREQAAQMALNTLTATMVEYTGGIDVTTGDTSISIGSTRGPVDAPAYSYQANANAAVATANMQFCEKYFPTLKLDKTGETDDFGYQSKVWFKGTTSTDYTWAATKEITEVVTAKVLATYTDKVGTVTRAALYNLTGIEGNIPVYENGQASGNIASAKGDSTPVFTAYKGAKVEVVDQDNDGNADAVLVSYAYTAKVTDVVAATPSTDRYVKMSVYNAQNAVTTIDNVEYTTEDFAKGDYVLVYLSGNLTATDDSSLSTAAAVKAAIIDVVAADNTVVGKVTKVTGINASAVTALTVNGTSYPVAHDKLATMGVGDIVSDTNFGYTSEYTLIMSNGFIVGVLGAAVVRNIENIVYVVTDDWTTTDAYNNTVYNVQVVHLDGKSEIITTTVNTTNTDVTGAGFYVLGTSNGQTTFAAATDIADDSNGGTNNDIDNRTFFYGVNAIDDASLTMTANTKSVTIDAVDNSGATRAYITANTRLMFVTGSKNTLKTSIAYGAMKQNIADDSVVLLSKTTSGNYEVEAIIIGAAQVDMTGNIVYVSNSAVGEVNINGSEVSTYNMWDLTTGAKTDVPAATPSTGFATYEIDSTGKYTFSSVSDAAAADGDGVYYAIENELSLYNNLLTLVDADDEDFTDLDASQAAIIWAGTGVKTLTLKNLVDASDLAATILVEDGAVLTIVVTSYTA